MNFHNLKSIVGSEKTSFPMRESTESFCLAPRREQPYIEPSFTKVAFEAEKPAVILISAVAVTGKSALAQVLSNETSLPLLDLGKHKPVGDNTLTGLLTWAFRVEDLSKVFEGIGNGTYGVIIDGVDEGRSKTTEKAFEAFLDDVVRLCRQARKVSFVLLGRTQVLEDCWVYLTDRGTSTGLMSILPFSLDGAREYIDAFTKGTNSSHVVEYVSARDAILNKLAAAFGDNAARSSETFLSFIGYPPVLDAIVTLLKEERNYHKLLADLEGHGSGDVEIDLLHRITSYVLRREKDQKVLPNIVRPLIADIPEQDKQAIVERVFGVEEQCMRLVGYCLGRQLNLERISNPLINEKYEEHLVSWLPEHPFVVGRAFRNAVFESVALATLMTSDDSRTLPLALDYAASHKYNYHTIYFLDRIARDGFVPISCLRVILGSALEFCSTSAWIELHVEGPEASDLPSGAVPTVTIDTQIDIIMGTAKEPAKAFRFKSELGGATSVDLGYRLSSSYVSLPCDVSLAGSSELELTAPIEISAAKIRLEAPTLILRPAASKSPDDQVLLEATGVESTAARIVTNGVTFTVAVSDRSGLVYPCVQYAVQREELHVDPSLKEKYLRLRRILLHFRSHGKGTLARYKDKIEHWRVLGNDTGWAILQRLKSDRILVQSGNFYFLQPEDVHQRLGVSYQDLRIGRTSERLLQYLRSIE